MPLPVVACSHCCAEMESQATHCSVCGAPRRSGHEQIWASEVVPQRIAARVVEKPAAAKTRIVDNPWVVLATIFFVTAAFGIPLIWMCKAWSRQTKIVLTGVTILYTIAILWVFMLIMRWCYNTIMQSL